TIRAGTRAGGVKVAKGGRPSKLDPEVQRCITEALAAGLPREVAAQQSGIGAGTLRAWCARGRKAGRGPYRAFLLAVRKAEAQAVVRNVLTVQRAAQGGQVIERTTTTGRDGSSVVREKIAPPQWKAAAWWLERRCPEDFGRHTELIAELRRLLRELERK